MSVHNSLFHKAFLNAPIGMSLISLDGRFINANPSLCKMLGYTDEELQALRFHELTHPDDLETELMSMNQLVAGTVEYYQTEKRYMHKNGKTLWGLTTVFLITDGENQPQYFVEQLIDLTLIQNLRQQLSDHEERYRIIDQSLLDMITEHTPDGLYKYVSTSCKAILGYEVSEMINRSTYDFVHPDDIHKIIEAHIACLEGQTQQAITFRIRKKDGTFIWLDTSIRPIYGVNGHVTAIICFSRDTTDRKNSENLLIQTEKLSIVGQLAAGIAHEIRNPLTSLLGFLDLIEKGDSKQLYFDIMRSELARIEYILSELLVVSKPQVVSYKDRDLMKILADVFTLMRSQAVMSNVELIIQELLPVSIFITCDENRIKQCLINLIKNGIEAMPDGGKLTIGVTTSNKTVQITIQDEGPGIPEDLLQHLGQPFYSTKEKGTGLGLMVSFKIIKDHNGTIEIKSQQNKGSSFIIQLPTL